MLQKKKKKTVGEKIKCISELTEFNFLTPKLPLSTMMRIKLLKKKGKMSEEIC